MNPMVGELWKFQNKFDGQIYYALTTPDFGLDLKYSSFTLSLEMEFLVLETKTVSGDFWIRILISETAEVGWIRPYPDYRFEDFERVV